MRDVSPDDRVSHRAAPYDLRPDPAAASWRPLPELPTALLIFLCLCLPAFAQDTEVDRQLAPPDRIDPLQPAPSAGPLPDRRLQGDPRFLPDSEPLGAFPTDLPPDPGDPGDLDIWSQIELRLDTVAQLGAGYDTNVFRADRSRTADGFGAATGEVEAVISFPSAGELFVELSAESRLYLERHRANEHAVGAFLEYFHPLTGWLDLGFQNTFEYSRQNLLDDNGDLFPRGRFGSIDEEARLYAILRPHRDWAFELGAGHRWKNFDENPGVESLDYRELRLDVSASYRLSREPRARLKLKYRFRRRDYREFTAREPDGNPAPDGPDLTLHRHQLSLLAYQELDLGPTQLRLIVSLGVAYNRDLHQNDRSYRELTGTVRAEWSLVPDVTRLDLTSRWVARNFLSRNVPNAGGNLRHRLLEFSLGFRQRLTQLTPPGQLDPVNLTVFAEATSTLWSTSDPRQDFERFVVFAGLEASW